MSGTYLTAVELRRARKVIDAALSTYRPAPFDSLRLARAIDAYDRAARDIRETLADADADALRAFIRETRS